MHARVVLGVGKGVLGKGVLFREVSSVQECPHRERERFHCSACWKTTLTLCVFMIWRSFIHTIHPHTLTPSPHSLQSHQV